MGARCSRWSFWDGIDREAACSLKGWRAMDPTLRESVVHLPHPGSISAEKTTEANCCAQRDSEPEGGPSWICWICWTRLVIDT